MVSSTIIAGLTNLKAIVTPVATCDAGLTVSVDAPSKTVPSGEQATFSETFTVSKSVTSTKPLTCTVEFRVNGLLPSQAFVQQYTVTPIID